MRPRRNPAFPSLAPSGISTNGRLLFRLVLSLSLLLAEVARAQSPTPPGPIDFSRDVLPVLTQAGCNSGACHGAAAGRGYLTLSLFGARPADDYRTLLFDMPGRFIDLEYPASSKLLQKPAGDLDHGGGMLLEENSAAYQRLLAWIAQGARHGIHDELLELKILPGRRHVAKVDQVVVVQIHATWRSGVSRDVTPWTAIVDADSLAAPGSPVQCVVQDDRIQFTPRQPGYWPITLRFATRSVTWQLYVPGEATDDGAYSNPLLAESSSLSNETVATRTQEPGETQTPEIDQLVEKLQRELNLAGGQPCSDAILVRRWWVDLLGRPPALGEWQVAVAALGRGERQQVVDGLLNSSEFRQRLADEMIGWCEAASPGRQATDRWRQELARAISENDTLPPLVRRMLQVAPVTRQAGADGQNDPLSDFHLLAAEPRSRVELITQSWMGVRLACARCHDHPLDRWTQADYFGLAAGWAGVDVREGQVRWLANAKTTDLRTGRDAVPALPALHVQSASAQITNASLTTPHLLTADEGNAAFIDWLIAPNNDLFYRNAVNRIWSWLLGSGLFMPVDDQRETNPAMHALLLDHLVAELRQSNGSLKQLVRSIVLSQTYRVQSTPAATPLWYNAYVVRQPKPIAIAPQTLAAQALSLDEKRDSLEGPHSSAADMTMMMSTNSNEGSCTRGVACRDPMSASIELVSGEPLNRLVHETVSGRYREHDSVVELMRQVHQQLFFDLPTPLQELGWPDELQAQQNAIASGRMDSAREENEALEAAEDLLWSWLVSDRFRKLH